MALVSILRQSLDQIAKLARAMPLGKVFLGPPADRLRKRTAIGAQLRETRIDFLQMFFAELGDFAARFATVILQIQDLLCFLERQAQCLRLLNKSDAPDRLGRVEPIICRGTVWFWQQTESLVIVQRLHTDSHLGCDLADFQTIYWPRVYSHFLSSFAIRTSAE